MKKLTLEEFAVIMYAEVINEILNNSYLRSGDFETGFYTREIKEQKEIESLIERYSIEISKRFVDELKARDLLREELSNEEEKIVEDILKKKVEEFISNVKKKP